MDELRALMFWELHANMAAARLAAHHDTLNLHSILAKLKIFVYALDSTRLLPAASMLGHALQMSRSRPPKCLGPAQQMPIKPRGVKQRNQRPQYRPPIRAAIGF